MKAYITSSKGKEHLVEAFQKAGWDVVPSLSAGLDLIIPTVDEELPFFASNRDWFFNRGMEVMVSNSDAIYQCRDKAEFNLWCARHSFQTPRTWQMNAYVKPRFGKGSKGIYKIDTSSIIQEASIFPEVSVDCFLDTPGHPASVVPRYRLDVVNGASTRMELVKDFDYETIIRFCTEMKLFGHVVIQGYWTGDVFIYGEVNPRFGGGSHMTFKLFNSPKFLMEMVQKWQHSSAQ